MERACACRATRDATNATRDAWRARAREEQACDRLCISDATILTASGIKIQPDGHGLEIPVSAGKGGPPSE